MALDLFVSGGKRNKKGETESEKRPRNKYYSSSRAQGRGIKGGGDTDGAREAWWHFYGGEKAAGLYAASEFRCVLFMRLKRGRAEESAGRGSDRKTRKRGGLPLFVARMR